MNLVQVKGPVKVVDGLLDPYEYDLLKKMILDDHDFPWYWRNQVLFESYEEGDSYMCRDLENWQLCHWFYKDGAPRSDQFDSIVPILDKLNIGALIKIKANLNPMSPEIVEHGFHYDQDWKNTKTCVYYVNDNNGFTLFEDGTKVYSKANRAVIFDGKTSHCGSTCTDEKRRIVINLNYYPIER